MKVRQKYILVTIIILFSIVSFSGCAPKTKIRGSDEMFTKNPVNKIAILSAGNVNWPRMGKGGDVLVVPHAKQANETLLSQVKKVLTDKGYEIVYAEPVGVGFNCTNWWLLENPEAENEEEVLKKIDNGDPIFKYPKFQEEGEYTVAVLNLIGQLEKAINMKQLYTFAPRKEDVEIIQKETSADTICLHRIYGKKFSAGRKAGAVALSVVAAMFGAYGGSSPHDMVESYFVFIDAKTGAVLWQYGLYATGDPLNPDQENMARILKFFPTKNQYFDEQSCPKGKDGFFYCK
ncbi:MAG: hypothetical protein JXC33_06665 [Deltaproteobacteria bacterium]|nr:hypothetical protein [Deltaproteobacteria bacterium]